jgi:hypothetical protein
MFDYAKSFDDLEDENTVSSGIQMSSEQFTMMILNGEKKLAGMTPATV